MYVITIIQIYIDKWFFCQYNKIIVRMAYAVRFCCIYRT